MKNPFPSRNLSRRALLRELLAAGVALPAASAMLASCGNSGGSDNTSSGGTGTGNAGTGNTGTGNTGTGNTGTGNAASPASASGTSSGGPIKIGFIPLTDCASIVVAQQMGLFKKHGVEVEVARQSKRHHAQCRVSGRSRIRCGQRHRRGRCATC